MYYPDDSCSQAPINFMKTFNQNEWVPGFADLAYSQIGVWDQKNPLSGNFFSYTLKADLCLMFPSNIAHSVSSNEGERPRISIAMDTLFTLKEYVRDEPLLPPPSDWKEYEL